MRIVVMSDSHGDFSQVLKVVKRNIGHCDMFIHLGDGGRDVERLRVMYPNEDIRHVRGNCDYSSDSPDTSVINADGVRILCTHGHRYGVDSGIEHLCEAALKNACRIALYGHTHARLDTSRDGIRIMNPGSCACPRDGQPPSFGVIETVGSDIVTGIFDV